MRRFHRRTWLTLDLAVVLFLSMLCARPTGSASESTLRKPDAATVATLKKNVPELMKEAIVPGVSLALIKGSTTYWVGDFGVRDVSLQLPVVDDTVFEAASLSKPVFAYGVLKLVDQGKLDLDVPLTHYLSEPYIQGDSRLEQITARYVLSHRTGFPNWRGDGNPLKIRFTPGERFSYSGEGFVYLQKVVEQMTGKSLNDYMTEAVFLPLGMSSSSYVWRADYDTRAATGHGGNGQVQEKSKPKEANAAASLHTTAGDYALFVEALLNGRGLKHATLGEMEQPQIAVDPECTNCADRVAKSLSKSLFWGLGVGIQETRQGESLWHWGDNGAFKCFVLAYPKQKLGFLLFTNGENGLSIAPEIVREALGGDQPAFGWIKYDRYDSPSMKFAKAVRDRGPSAAIEEFRPALMRGDIPENSINAAGYQLLSQKKPSQAIQIFQLNVQLFPQSANAYDSLGEAYMDNGDKDLAIQNYQKSLVLNPENTKAVEMLKKMQP